MRYRWLLRQASRHEKASRAHALATRSAQERPVERAVPGKRAVDSPGIDHLCLLLHVSWSFSRCIDRPFRFVQTQLVPCFCIQTATKFWWELFRLRIGL